MFLRAFLINYRTFRSCELSRRRSAKFALAMASRKEVVVNEQKVRAGRTVEFKVVNGMAYGIVKQTCPATPDCDLNNPCPTCPVHRY